MLSVRDVEKSFGGIRAVNGCSLEVERQSIVGIMGPNGAGKTTLFNIISGFEQPDRGAIVFKGENIEAKNSFEIARMGLIRTFQLTKVLSRMTVEENLLLAPKYQQGERIWNVWLRAREVRREEESNRARAHSLLRLFGLLPLKEEYAGALSGGQKRLLELARALMAEPDMLLLDEPFSGVNPTLGNKLLNHIKELRDRFNMTILIIEHDMHVIMRLCDYIYVLNRGRVIASGTPEEVQNDERVLDAYLGGGQYI